jgi:transcriptional regulator with XRE-family HTH domain
MTVIAADACPGTLGGPSTGDVCGPTSNQFRPQIAPALAAPFLMLALLTGGAAPTGHTESPQLSQSATYGGVASRTQRAVLTAQGQPVGDEEGATLPELAKSVRSLRQRSGLTWDELARIFGVTRRTLYNWSIGGQVSAANARAIADVIGSLHEIDAGDPRVTRSRLLAPTENGATLYARLIQQRRQISHPSAPVYSPDQLLGARYDSPDQTGKVVDFDPLD